MTLIIDREAVGELANLGAIGAVVAGLTLLTEDVVPGPEDLSGLRWLDDETHTRYLRLLREDLDQVGEWIESFYVTLDEIERDCE